MAATHYSRLQRTFHWLIALLVLGNIIGALTAIQLGEDSDLAKQIWGLHVSTGLLILLLIVARLITRLLESVPDPLPSWSRWTQRLSRVGHWLLYGLVLLIPIFGYLLIAFKGHGVDFYGLFKVPPVVTENHDLHELAEEMHVTLAWILIVAIAGHVVFALKHHFMDHDSTLRRMIRGS